VCVYKVQIPGVKQAGAQQIEAEESLYEALGEMPRKKLIKIRRKTKVGF